MQTKPALLFVFLVACFLGSNRVVGDEGASRTDRQDAVAGDRVEQLLAQMTLREKVGQMTQAELSELHDYSEITDLSLGSILSGGNSDPEAGNSAEAWRDAYNACQSAAMESRLSVPLLYGIDAVHGHNNVLNAVIFPHHIGLGCGNDEAIVEQIGRLTALEIRATGIQWTFAPSVAVPQDDRWGRTYEGFSENTDRVTRLSAAMVRGLQTDDLGSAGAVLACAKHFIGDGGTRGVIRSSPFHSEQGMYWDQGDTPVDMETLRRVHLPPYEAALAEGVGSIMPSYSSVNGVKCTINKELLTGLLKNELGFRGFLISDYRAINQCHKDYKTAVGLSINAGIDMAMAPNDFREYIDALVELVEEGTVPMARIDDAVRRILSVKAAMGMLDDSRDQLADQKMMEGFGDANRRLVAREAVGKSLVVLKNQDALPIPPSTKRVRVIGPSADDLGIQCGGWTIGWQGQTGEVTTGGTTVLAGLREVGEGIEFSFEEAFGSDERADSTIVVVGERPYAEGLGDNAELSLTKEDRELVLSAGESGAPVILVILSGRPLVLDDEVIETADAIVAAWLPGTEGAGVADVLLGRRAPSGTLGFSWPRTADQHPINIGDENYDPRWPFEHGLTWEVAVEAAP